MHKCAADHDAMTSIHRKHGNQETNEQHTELGEAKSSRDFADMHIIQGWFDQHEFFAADGSRLRWDPS